MAKKKGSASRGTDKIPASAKSGGSVNQNIAQDTQRNPIPVADKERVSGPQVGEKGEYLPATYDVVKERVPRPGAKPEKHTIIREDF